jgi:hypothetical protein
MRLPHEELDAAIDAYEEVRGQPRGTYQIIVYHELLGLLKRHKGTYQRGRFRYCYRASEDDISRISIVIPSRKPRIRPAEQSTTRVGRLRLGRLGSSMTRSDDFREGADW